MVVNLEGTSGKRTVWMIPIAAIVIWELLNLVVEFMPFIRNSSLLVAPIIFFLEFAILPVISLWLGAHAAKKRGLKFADVMKEFAIFFAAFLITAFVVTLATTSALSRLDRLAVSIGMFAFLAAIKLALCLVALLIGMYLPSGSSWGGFRLFGAAISVLALLAALVLGAALGQFLASTTNVQHSAGFSYDVEKCTPGEWASISVLGMDMNMTTTGRETYRTLETCHSGANITFVGSHTRVDVYSIDSDTRCTLTNSTSSRAAVTVKETCKGDWPGYEGPKD